MNVTALKQGVRQVLLNITLVGDEQQINLAPLDATLRHFLFYNKWQIVENAHFSISHQIISVAKAKLNIIYFDYVLKFEHLFFLVIHSDEWFLKSQYRIEQIPWEDTLRCGCLFVVKSSVKIDHSTRCLNNTIQCFVLHQLSTSSWFVVRPQRIR